MLPPCVCANIVNNYFRISPFNILYFGNVTESNRIVDVLLPSVHRYLANRAVLHVSAILPLYVLNLWPVLLRLLNRCEDATVLFDALSVGQARTDPNYQAFIAGSGTMLSPRGAPPLCGKGFYSPVSLGDHVAACCIMVSDVLDTDGRVTLDELASVGGREWALASRVHEAQSQSIVGGTITVMSAAWAFEKHGMLDSALDFARQV